MCHRNSSAYETNLEPIPATNSTQEYRRLAFLGFKHQFPCHVIRNPSFCVLTKINPSQFTLGLFHKFVVM